MNKILLLLIAFSCSKGTGGETRSPEAGAMNGPCSNGQKEHGEVDIDCGGSCGPCTDGKQCSSGSDCVSGLCAGNGRCTRASCGDNTLAGGEVGIDCGGPCPLCPGDTCSKDEQCLSGFCKAGVCDSASCTDGIKNGRETGVDCGAGDCLACANGLGCLVDTNCLDRFCSWDGVCAAASCNDGARNQSETDVDCGGPCAPCGNESACTGNNDCSSGKCVSGKCQALSDACSDEEKSAGETDVDCGGDCGGCAYGKLCETPSDCVSVDCAAGRCAAPLGCQDAKLSPSETDTDCGGKVCPGCGLNSKCKSHTDCVTLACRFGLCDAPACDDEFANGGETDTDCGGSCAGCADGMKCSEPQDCEGGNCTAGHCGSCHDGLENGDETDTDCGGVLCAACADTKACANAGDCLSALCELGTCVSCFDGEKNASETDADCGGNCDACAVGKACGKPGDCQSNVCEHGFCCQTNSCGTCGPSPVETCNGIDDDCDDQTDEELSSPPPCPNQQGVCIGSKTVCMGVLSWACSNTVYAQSSGWEKIELTCDGQDNDCDGLTDEELVPKLCTNQAGTCKGSTSTCAGEDGWLCKDSDFESMPDWEVIEISCDGKDNDCNGATDENLTPPFCPNQEGVCAGVVAECGGVQGWVCKTCQICLPKFSGPTCSTCANSHFSADQGCDVCLPNFTGPECSKCADPHFAEPGCVVCAPEFGGPACAECANSYLAPPDCNTCLPMFTGADCSQPCTLDDCGGACGQCASGDPCIGGKCTDCGFDAESYGGKGVDVVVSSSGYAVAATSPEFAAAKMRLVLVDPNGSSVSAHSYYDVGRSRASSLVGLAGGGFAIGGLLYPPNSVATQQAYVVRTDAQANSIWQWRPFNFVAEEVRALATDGASILAVVNDGVYELKDGVYPNSNEQVKWDVQLSVSLISCCGPVNAKKIAAVGPGLYAVAGARSSNGSGSPWVLLLDAEASGATVWESANWGHPGWIDDIAPDHVGGLWVALGTASIDGLSWTNHIVHVAADGKAADILSETTAYHVQALAARAPNTLLYAARGLKAAGADDVLFHELDATGATLWQATLGVSGDDVTRQISRIVMLEDGSVLAVGSQCLEYPCEGNIWLRKLPSAAATVGCPLTP